MNAIDYSCTGPPKCAHQLFVSPHSSFNDSHTNKTVSLLPWSIFTLWVLHFPTHSCFITLLQALATLSNSSFRIKLHNWKTEWVLKHKSNFCAPSIFLTKYKVRNQNGSLVHSTKYLCISKWWFASTRSKYLHYESYSSLDSLVLWYYYKVWVGQTMQVVRFESNYVHFFLWYCVSAKSWMAK